eukprot:TRINITY_DN5310_c0_g2_i1.p1 TRINITY_DN5310_c0_g2~~TRINITY_DN5310_c0_g2_i1.p1  ORF type:complete len:140 (+),score=27.23 TRINITY_DN5310_c0_g2_i1:58-420(+)
MKISCAGFQTGILLNYKYPTNSMHSDCLKGCDKLIYDKLSENFKCVRLYPVILKTHESTSNYYDDGNGSHALIYAFTKDHYHYFCQLVEEIKRRKIFSKLPSHAAKSLEAKLKELSLIHI